MCTPQAAAAARAIGAARKKDMSVEGVNLNNLKDIPRQLALTTAAVFSPLKTIGSVGGAVVRDITKQGY